MYATPLFHFSSRIFVLMEIFLYFFFFFFFNNPPPPEIYPLPLPDALPIPSGLLRLPGPAHGPDAAAFSAAAEEAVAAVGLQPRHAGARRHLQPLQHGTAVRVQAPQIALARSEEHTSELQSQSNLVCRLLLE